MDKETLSHYGWIVVLILILSVMMAFATPFGQFIADGFKATYVGFGNVNDSAFGIFGQTIKGPVEVKYYQPYRAEFDLGTIEYVFHKDGTVDIYETEYGYGEYGDVYESGSAIYKDGTIELDGVIFQISDDGTVLNAEDPNGEKATFTLIPTPIKPIQMGVEYVCFDGEWEYVQTFNADGSGTYIEYQMGEEDYRYDSPVGEFKYFDQYFEEHYYDEYNGQTYIDRCAIYPDGTKIILWGGVYELAYPCEHTNTEIRNNNDYYSGDKVCIDCGRVLEQGKGSAPGLYTENKELVADWNTLVDEYGVDFMNDYTFSEDGSGSLLYAMEQNVELQSGVILVMPNDLTHIGNYTSYSDYRPTYLKKIIFGKNLKSIGTGAFINIKTLEEIVLPDGLETIGWGAFMGCSNLTEIKVPESVTTLSEYAFNDCDKLIKVNIPTNITKVSFALFSGCDSLSNIYLHEGITIIDGHAFSGCINLKNIDIPDSVTTIGYSAFRDSGIVSITIPNGITKIEDSTFAYCESLTSVNLPNTIKTIDEFAFSGCTNLSTINLPDSVTTIGRSAFNNSGLVSIKIPNGVTMLDEYVFEKCANLETIELSQNLVRISYAAFKNSGLKNIIIPKSVQVIERSAFTGCTQLTSATFEDKNGWLLNRTSAINLDLPQQNATYLYSTYSNCSWVNET